MWSSISNPSRRLYRTLLWNPSPHHRLSQLHFCTDHLPLSDSEDTPSEQQQQQQQQQRPVFDRPLENGLDAGIYRAILVGEAGQKPVQKKLRSGTVVTLLSIGTGGIRNNRRPLQNENPTDYANRCSVQWHRVSVYPERLGTLIAKNVIPGSLLYVEGNLETKVFSDPITGLVRRIREVAVRRNGRVVFLSQGGDADQQTQKNDLRAVGYY